MGRPTCVRWRQIVMLLILFFFGGVILYQRNTSHASSGGRWSTLPKRLTTERNVSKDNDSAGLMPGCLSIKKEESYNHQRRRNVRQKSSLPPEKLFVVENAGIIFCKLPKVASRTLDKIYRLLNVRTDRSNINGIYNASAAQWLDGSKPTISLRAYAKRYGKQKATDIYVKFKKGRIT